MEAKDIKERIITNSGVNPKKCMQCGKCSGTCPAYEEMEYHPNEFVNMVETGDIEKLLASKSLYKCLTCFECVDRCPRNVEPSKLIEAIRLEALRMQENNHLEPKDLPSKIDEQMPQQGIVSAFRKYWK